MLRRVNLRGKKLKLLLVFGLFEYHAAILHDMTLPQTANESFFLMK